MFTAEVMQIATKLNEATKAGNLAGAYGVVTSLRAEQLRDVLLQAGYSVGLTSDPKFKAFAQQDIAAACKAKQDGAGYTYACKQNARGVAK